MHLWTDALHVKIHSSTFAISYLDLHASNRFAQLKHDKDQAGVYWFSATGAGLLPEQHK